MISHIYHSLLRLFLITVHLFLISSHVQQETNFFLYKCNFFCYRNINISSFWVPQYRRYIVFIISLIIHFSVLNFNQYQRVIWRLIKSIKSLNFITWVKFAYINAPMEEIKKIFLHFKNVWREYLSLFWIDSL
jgi:hypothetical protein